MVLVLLRQVGRRRDGLTHSVVRCYFNFSNNVLAAVWPPSVVALTTPLPIVGWRCFGHAPFTMEASHVVCLCYFVVSLIILNLFFFCLSALFVLDCCHRHGPPIVL